MVATKKDCKKHGLVLHRLESRGKNKSSFYRCTKCASESVARKRKKIKEEAVKYKGGKCEICGYNKCYAALEFHHLDPNEKDFGIASKGICRSWDKVKEELDKCIILCANCHRELHDNR